MATVYFASDHAGFHLKESVRDYVHQHLGHEVVDFGAFAHDELDDYPDFISRAGAHISKHPSDKAIIFGGSGQGEAIVANRFPQVRAVVWYGSVSAREADQSGEQSGDGMEIIDWARKHNDANVLSLGARFLSAEEAIQAVSLFLSTSFSEAERHSRRIKKIEEIEIT